MSDPRGVGLGATVRGYSALMVEEKIDPNSDRGNHWILGARPDRLTRASSTGSIETRRERC